MQAQSFQDAVEALAQKDTRYHEEAYAFLRDALEAALKRRKKAKKDVGGHVTAEELLDAFRVHALKEFGPMTVTVLDYWGVKNCEDVGNMVFNLVEAGVFGKTENDTPDAFRLGYDFHSAFVIPFEPAAKKLSETPAPIVGERK